MSITTNEVFKIICDHACNAEKHCVVSAKEIAQLFNVDMEDVKEAVAEPINDGLIKVSYRGGVNDEGQHYIIRGYCITPSAMDTEIYKMSELAYSADNEQVREKIAPNNQGTKNSPLRAIRKYCIDCCCGSYSEVRQCPDKACPLWRYRAGHRPESEYTEEVS